MSRGSEAQTQQTDLLYWMDFFLIVPFSVSVHFYRQYIQRGKCKLLQKSEDMRAQTLNSTLCFFKEHRLTTAWSQNITMHFA